jgi:hypothetical protein
MIECVRRQSGSRLPSMVVIHLQNCTWRTSPSMQENAALAHVKEHLSWHVQRGRGTCAGVGKRGASFIQYQIL